MRYTGNKINETALESARWILRNKITGREIPTLLVFTNPNNRGCVSYVNALRKDFMKVGVRLFECAITETMPADQIVNAYASTIGVSAVMIQLPLGNPNLDYTELVTRLRLRGASVIDVASGTQDTTHITPKTYMQFPCTSRAILTVLKDYFSNRETGLEGLRVTIVNRSNAIGRPLAALLLNENAGVTIYHSKIDTDFIISDAINHTHNDAFVTATGVAGLIDPRDTYICPFIIDIGTGVNVEGKLCGDISSRFQNYLESSPNEDICPSKGGVGPVTRAMVIADTIRCFFEKYEPEEELDSICEWTANLNRPFYVP